MINDYHRQRLTNQGSRCMRGSVTIDVHTKLRPRIRTHALALSLIYKWREDKYTLAFETNNLGLVGNTFGHEAGSGSAQPRPPAGQGLCC